MALESGVGQSARTLNPTTTQGGGDVASPRNIRKIIGEASLLRQFHYLQPHNLGDLNLSCHWPGALEFEDSFEGFSIGLAATGKSILKFFSKLSLVSFMALRAFLVRPSLKLMTRFETMCLAF